MRMLARLKENVSWRVSLWKRALLKRWGVERPRLDIDERILIDAFESRMPALSYGFGRGQRGATWLTTERLIWQYIQMPLPGSSLHRIPYEIEIKRSDVKRVRSTWSLDSGAILEIVDRSGEAYRFKTLLPQVSDQWRRTFRAWLPQ